MKALWALVGSCLTAALLPAAVDAEPRNTDAVAVIIGNKDYGDAIPEVSFALNDAAAMKRYVVEVLGFDPENVIELTNATAAQMTATFGNERDHKGKLWSYLDSQGVSDIVVFYSGHGLPGLADRRAYLLPVDADADRPQINGYPLGLLYENLGKLKVRSVTVYLDACFSGGSGGGMVIAETSGILVAPKAIETDVDLAVLTAARGKQVASWDKQAKHGLFTRHLLDALYGAADAKRYGKSDGKVTLGEAKAYLDGHMTRAARRTYLREQDAGIEGRPETVLTTLPEGKPIPRPALGAKAQEVAVVPTPPKPAPVFEVAELDESRFALKRSNLRAGPGTEFDRVGRLEAGAEIDVTGKVEGKNWLRVALKEGGVGYVYAPLLETAGKTPKATEEPIQAGEPTQVVLPSGMTLADWTLLSEGRLKKGDLEQLLVEAVSHRRQYGITPALEGVIDAAVVGLLKGIDVGTREDARRALPKLRRIAASAGDRLPILSRQARAHHVLKEYGEAIAAYVKWLRLAPVGHAKREQVALGLFKAQNRKTLGPEVGTVLKDCDVCPEMVVVPAGAFQMGSPSSEGGHSGDEGPQHRVMIPKAFAVGKYEVTFQQWGACVSAGGCNGYRPEDENWGRGRHPVINVSWKDAKAYVEWLSRKTGNGYRLLTESEWEYAARAGTTTPFHFGVAISTAQANYDGNYVYGSGRKGEYRRRTISVGSLVANRFGLHDVHGNVWEWVEDCWNRSYSGAPSDGSAWTSGECGRRVLRGGSWFYVPRFLRSALRNGYDPDFRTYYLGFRVARTLEE
jgi:formylglycine-generating enzyme required for sulfatase activity/uncharacterized caspase-like protein